MQTEKKLFPTLKSLCQKTFLHHGDADARKWFAESLKKTNAKIIDPKPLEIYET